MSLDYRTFSLDPETNDMSVDANGNFAGFTTRIDQIRQLVVCYLQTFLGEIPTNLALGVDYHGIIFPEFLTQGTKINELVRVILTVPGVQTITDFNISPNRQTGEMDYDFVIQTDAGGIQYQQLLS